MYTLVHPHQKCDQLLSTNVIYKIKKSIDKTVTRASLQQAAVDVYSEGLSSEIQ